ncbi:MAG: 4Fe-4S binding protein [Bacteroidales bacterium]|nr:4Fe-4S binding protein [Bacteroidales bacterium]
MPKSFFHHALKVNEDICTGCMHCLKKCPTEAIRMRSGKAKISANCCIDCGECFDACPDSAIYIEHDDLNTIFNYDYRIALVPAVLINQFKDDIPTPLIYQVIKELGFTHIFEIEQMADFLIEEIRKYAVEHAHIKPLISSFCPAIVRLIQVKFPSLTENLVLLKPPVDLAAMYWRQTLKKQGVSEDKIGLFYITPCAAKIAALKTPVGEEESQVTGVINMDFIYNRVLRKIKEEHRVDAENVELSKISSRASLWSTTEGEKKNMLGRALAIDGVHNISEFLEKVENDELPDVDYLELRACDESCAGGILLTGNRFLTVERMKKRAETIRESETPDNHFEIDNDIADYMRTNMGVQKVLPRSMMCLDENRGIAMKKMALIRDLMSHLPGVDCGTCGAPTCQALAEDIAKVEATLTNCIFLQTSMEGRGSMTAQERVETFRKIWGNK